MKPLPLHRSLLFWLGLPGLLFILWAWQDSMAHRAGVFRKVEVRSPNLRARHQDELSYHRSLIELKVFTMEPAPDRSIITRPPEIQRMPFSKGNDHLVFFPPGFKIETQELPSAMPGLAFRSIRIAHWVILLAYGSAWSGLMFWRQRRIRRAERSA